MKERKLTVRLKWANIFSFIMLAITSVIALVLWACIWGIQAKASGEMPYSLRQEFILIAFILVGIIVHELIHGITWAYFAKSGFKSISFGIIWKMLTPYCHCSEPMKVRPYIIGALMPLIILGILPFVFGLCFGWGFVVTYGVVFIASASGDILIAWKLRREPAEHTVLDHPTEAGCIIYEEEK